MGAGRRDDPAGGRRAAVRGPRRISAGRFTTRSFAGGSGSFSQARTGSRGLGRSGGRLGLDGGKDDCAACVAGSRGAGGRGGSGAAAGAGLGRGGAAVSGGPRGAGRGATGSPRTRDVLGGSAGAGALGGIARETRGVSALRGSPQISHSVQSGVLSAPQIGQRMRSRMSASSPAHAGSVSSSASNSAPHRGHVGSPVATKAPQLPQAVASGAIGSWQTGQRARACFPGMSDRTIRGTEP